MPHTHHSHSGQFCNHATDSLPSILTYMVNVKRMTTVALTEHIGRPIEHLYPDELMDGWTPERLSKAFDDFTVEAIRLRNEYAIVNPNVQILIGFEGEWIDDSPDLAQRRIEDVLTRYPNLFDLWIGSVHHVHSEPIDYDSAGYCRALAKSGGDEDALFCSFFDSQYELISRLRPPVVGHFDLIRLKSTEPDRDMKHRAGVWPRIQRNLSKIQEYGGVLEINSSGLRKGLVHPYPRGEIVSEWNGMRGQLVLSDDSHGILHVGANYSQILGFLKGFHVSNISVLQKGDRGKSGCTLSQISLTDLEKHPFWTSES